jgi:microcystin-dependent protein
MSEPYLGEIRMFAGDYAPQQWAFCDGALLEIATHNDLFALLGTAYGGDGTRTFALRGRVPVHVGQGPGLSPHARGQTGGSEHVQLKPVELPPHSHVIYASTADGSSTSPDGKILAKSTAPQSDANPTPLLLYTQDTPSTALAPNSLSISGRFAPHENRPPYVVLSYIISLSGIYPSRA